jgi:hypothetical protein
MGRCCPCIQMIIVHRTHECHSSHPFPSPRAPRSRPTGHNRDPVAAAAGRFPEIQPQFARGRKFLLDRRGGPDLPVPGRRSVLRASFLLSPRGLAQSFWAGGRISQLRRLLPESMEVRDRLCHPTTGGSSPPSAHSPSTAKCASLEPLRAPPAVSSPGHREGHAGSDRRLSPSRRFLSTEEPPERGDPWHRTSR